VNLKISCVVVLCALSMSAYPENKPLIAPKSKSVTIKHVQVKNVKTKVPSVSKALPTANLFKSPLSYFRNKQWDIGLVATATQTPYVGGDTVVSARPIVRAADGFDIPGLSWSFSKQPKREIFLGTALDEWDYKRGDSTQLKDMHDLKQAVNLRLGATWKQAKGVTNLEIGQDIRAHKGQQAKVRFTYNPAPYDAKLRPYVEGQWLSSKMADYYVGVNADEAKVGRPAYEAGNAFAFKAGLKYERPLTQRITLNAGLDGTTYSKEITDSPIIARDVVWGTYAGATYRW
jgi:outer membrane scaffolding protein for murein synthesis (MipA/OmpV family)